MNVPTMLDMADVMMESGFTEEMVFDEAIRGSIVFLVVVPLIGACRVPDDALSHFMAGVDEYIAEGMPEHYSGALSGRWTIKRERLRILPKSWNEYSADAMEIDRLDNLANQAEAQPTPCQYYLPMYPRLAPRTPWTGGRITETDVLTLTDAASMATKHAGEPVTTGDILRAAGRGEITLRAILHRTAKVQKHDGGIYCNAGQENENTAPAGAIATLPLSACQHLAATGRASWRTFDGFEVVDGVMQRYTQGQLVAGEPDFETVPHDCRVMGSDVHALADAFTETDATQAAPVEAAPVLEVPEWELTEPNRFQGYAKPLYLLLQTAHNAKQRRPTARNVIDAFAASKPDEIEQTLPNGFDYYDAEGNTKGATLAAISESIRRMTAKNQR